METLKSIVSFVIYWIALSAPSNAFFYLNRTANGGQSTYGAVLVSTYILIATMVVFNRLNIRNHNVLSSFTEK